MGSSRRERLAADPVRGWLDTFFSEIGGLSDPPSPLSIVAAVVTAGAAEIGSSMMDSRKVRSDLAAVLDGCEEPPGRWTNPWLPGLVHEQAVSADIRKVRGAWYTPRPLVEGLVRFIDETADVPDFAVDPTCGGGAFLLAVLDRWVEAGEEPGKAMARVAGTDVDSDAVAVCRWALQLWAAGHGCEVDQEAIDVTVADALADDAPTHWPKRRLVVGNPPFASPLKKGAIPESARAYRLGHTDDLGQYADLAALHLHRCLGQAGTGSVVSLVLPQSVVSSRDVASFRDKLALSTATVGMWAAREAAFDASIRTCAPVVVVGASQPPVVSLAGGAYAAGRDATEAGRWSTYAARCLGGPPLPPSVVNPAKTLSALCSATAGFRDEYYGLVEACYEWDGDGEPPNRLVTVGSVDPLTTTWGASPIRFGGRQWQTPVIATDLLDDKVKRWTTRQTKPKVVVATQSKLLEPVVDSDGRIIPSTPLLAVHAAPDDLAAIAAVCLAPPVVASAWERWFGSAMAVDALKLAASQLGELPLPPDRKRWNEASDLIADHVMSGATLSPEQARSLAQEVAAIMNQAYRADAEVLQWWIARSKGNRSAAQRSPR